MIHKLLIEYAFLQKKKTFLDLSKIILLIQSELRFALC